jgi:hypothetical protein
MAGVITGRVEVLVNGILLLNKAGAKAEGIGESGKIAVERVPVMGDTGLHGPTETVVPARCIVTISDRNDILLSDLAKIQGDGTVIFRAAGGRGKTYTMQNAYCKGALALTAGEGETEVEFFGEYWTETSATS